MSDELNSWISAALQTKDLSASQGNTAQQGKPGPIDQLVAQVEADQALGKSIAFDDMAAVLSVRGPLPWNKPSVEKTWNDTDDSQLFAYCQSRYGAKNEKDVRHALTIVGNHARFNPLIDLIDTLPAWDGEKRAGHLLNMFLGVEDNVYTQEVERLLFSGAIMRTYHPGTKFDSVAVLIGKQGIGKSTFVRGLALDDRFFTDNLSGMEKREGAELIQGKLIVEISELSALKGKDMESIKAFISRQSDNYREPYKKHSSEHSRRCIFIGTTNNPVFLRDQTGNRRFFPVQCGSVPTQYSPFDKCFETTIKQAWAEMLTEYHQAGKLPLELSASAKEMAATQQENASIEDPRVGLIEEWLTQRAKGEKICTSQIVQEALEIPRKNQKTWQVTQVREIMQSQFPEWEEQPGKKRVDGYGVQRVYQKAFTGLCK